MSNRRRTIAAATTGTKVDLDNLNRFGGQGGAIQVRSTADDVTVDNTYQVLIGETLVTQDVLISKERAAGVGPDGDTLPKTYTGGPGEPIEIKVTGNGAQKQTFDLELINL